ANAAPEKATNSRPGTTRSRMPRLDTARSYRVGSAPEMLASVASFYSNILTSVFSSPIAAKAWLATAALVLAVVQVSTGARIFGKLKHVIRIPPPFVNRVHRWSGRLAILCTLPIAFHCIFILGFQSFDTRVLVHSILGSFVYGVIAVKVFYARDRDHPR